MLFSLFQEVQYPEFMMPLRGFMPYTAFLMAAFSALRLAKFNIDTRQTSSFIGLPTPANALFWGSLIVGQHAFLVSGRFNAMFLFLFMLLFCFLLVAELPLFALKFKNFGWADNKVKYIFLLGCLPCFLLVESCFAGIILWYVLLSIISPLISPDKDND
jgi:CDP-diacylglycerol--serine O-phosphatidyltransferase